MRLARTNLLICCSVCWILESCSPYHDRCSSYPARIEILNTPFVGLREDEKERHRNDISLVASCLRAKYYDEITGPITFVYSKEDEEGRQYYQFKPGDETDKYFVVVFDRNHNKINVYKFGSVSGPAL